MASRFRGDAYRPTIDPSGWSGLERSETTVFSNMARRTFRGFLCSALSSPGHSSLGTWLLFATIVLSHSASLSGQDAALQIATTKPTPEQGRTVENVQPNPASIDDFRREAEEYRIALSNHQKPELNSTPILKWTNQVREDQDGALFVWMLDDRPQVLGCVFTYHYREQVRRKHQLHSLAMMPLTATINDTEVWHPKTPGVEFRAIPNVGMPEKDAAKQKLQMRRLSRRFAATVDGDKEGTSELRLLPTPLLTYNPQQPDCQAGGIFAFASGTDPDLLLLLEIREIEQKPVWSYAFARFHYNRLTASLDSTHVWEAPQQLGMKLDRRESSAFQESVYVSFRTQ